MMFKNKKIMITFVALAIILLSLVYSKNKLEKLEMNFLPMVGAAGDFSELKIDTIMPELPKQMKVFKVKDLKLSKEDMIKQMNQFDVNGEINENDDEYAVVDGEKTFILDKKTGSINYYTKELTNTIKPIENLLLDEEYKEMAEIYLKEKDLMSDGVYYKKTLRHMVGKTNQPEQVCLVEVVFTTDLEGQRFTGVGPKICVFFGENAEIIGMYSVWKELEAYENYPIVSPEKAIENIINKKAIIINAAEGDVGNIYDIEIIYDMESLRSNQKYIIPYYYVKGENSNGNEFTALTRAISDEYLIETDLYGTSDKKNYKSYKENSKEILPNDKDIGDEDDEQGEMK